MRRGLLFGLSYSFLTGAARSLLQELGSSPIKFSQTLVVDCRWRDWAPPAAHSSFALYVHPKTCCPREGEDKS